MVREEPEGDFDWVRLRRKRTRERFEIHIGTKSMVCTVSCLSEVHKVSGRINFVFLLLHIFCIPGHIIYFQLITYKFVGSYPDLKEYMSRLGKTYRKHLGMMQV